MRARQSWAPSTLGSSLAAAHWLLSTRTAKILYVDAEEGYRQAALHHGRLLVRHGFTRMCDYRRRITPQDLSLLRAKLSTARTERPIHRLLAERSHLVVNAELAHGCRWIKSNPQLGAEYSPDFAVVRLDSGGLRWTLMELQNPVTKLFIQNGQGGEELREGIHQVGQWRSWIRRWGENGVEDHGYPGLRGDFRPVVAIGRSADKLQDLHGDDRIRALESEHLIEIRSYDYIYRAAWVELHDCGVEHGRSH